MFYFYRVFRQLLSVTAGEEAKVFLRIPAGAVVAVTQQPSADSKFVEILWDRNRSAVFVQDLLARAELIQPADDGQLEKKMSINLSPAL